MAKIANFWNLTRNFSKKCKIFSKNVKFSKIAKVSQTFQKNCQKFFENFKIFKKFEIYLLGSKILKFFGKISF